MGDIRIFDIEQIKNKFKLDVFFETGTFRGDTVDFYKNIFKKVFSVEIDQELADNAVERFKNCSNVEIYKGSSIAALEYLLPKITKTNENILFWLDAHFPGADAHKCDYDSEKNQDLRLPLEKELEIILKLRPNYKDVIIIDDMWLYEDGNYEWGSFNNHMKSIGSNVTKEKLGVKNSDFIYNLIKDKFLYIKEYKHQGYLIIYPK